MVNRREFNKYFPALLGSPLLLSCEDKINSNPNSGPLIVSTWANTEANTIAQQQLLKNDLALLDAIEKGINSVEENPKDTSVGYGGFPDSSGEVTLDACIMDKNGNAGSVTYLKNIVHAVSVARKVMEDSPHVILSGEGANSFAYKKGFQKTDLMTETSRERFEKWKEKSIYKPEINSEKHDTIGMIAKNNQNDISGACSTSGLAFKSPGRVGDSPIIGSGLFVDNEIGAATATGLGEVILKSCSTFLVVELMRQGYTPELACKEALLRIKKKYDVKDLQVGLIALNKRGEFGGYGIQPGFVFAVSDSKSTQVINSKSLL